MYITILYITTGVRLGKTQDLRASFTCSLLEARKMYSRLISNVG